MKNHFLRNNSLSIVITLFFLLSLAAQFFSGMAQKNQERRENGRSALSIGQYASSGHFIQATFENWESEFLQMAIYVVLTISLRQKGSSESKKLTVEESVDRAPRRTTSAPWPVRKGGIYLRVYENSLSLAFAILFLLSFLLHLYGSLKNQNEENLDKGMPLETLQNYLGEPRFWFESFQNWQSEFYPFFPSCCYRSGFAKRAPRNPSQSMPPMRTQENDFNIGTGKHRPASFKRC